VFSQRQGHIESHALPEARTVNDPCSEIASETLTTDPVGIERFSLKSAHQYTPAAAADGYVAESYARSHHC
jgi:hypothetical protein